MGRKLSYEKLEERYIEAMNELEKLKLEFGDDRQHCSINYLLDSSETFLSCAKILIEGRKESELKAHSHD